MPNIEAVDYWISAFAHFRRELRQALWDYYPNNPGSSDEELIDAVAKVVQEHKKDLEAIKEANEKIEALIAELKGGGKP